METTTMEGSRGGGGGGGGGKKAFFGVWYKSYNFRLTQLKIDRKIAEK